MSVFRSVVRGVLTVGSGATLGQLLAFIRNLLIARLIGPDNFGVAATFVLIIALLEMVSDLGLDLFVVQSPDGDQPALQGVCHLASVGRGTLNMLMLLALAAPISHGFDLPEDATWAFVGLSLVPMILGFKHLDPMRITRHMRFLPNITVRVISQAASLLAVWPLSYLSRDYWLMLGVLVTQASVAVVITQVMAARPYRWNWSSKYVRALASFGWPLMLNGLVLFAAGHSDRLLIGFALTMRELGMYSVATTLTMTISTLIAGIGGTVLLPVLSPEAGTEETFQERFGTCVCLYGVGAVAISVPFILIGDQLITMLYGGTYGDAGYVVGWLAVVHAVRLMRMFTITTALSRGNSKLSLASHLIRVSGLGLAFLAVLLGGGLVAIAACGLVGECLALAANVGFLWKWHDLSIRISVWVTTIFCVAVVGAVLGRIVGIQGWIAGSVYSVVLVVGLGSIMIFWLPERQIMRIRRLIPERMHIWAKN